MFFECVFEEVERFFKIKNDIEEIDRVWPGRFEKYIRNFVVA